MTLLVSRAMLDAVTTLSERIKWILSARGWSARELGRRADLAETHVSLIANETLTGERVAAATLAKIAHAGAVELHWLVTGEGRKERVAEEIHPAVGRVAEQLDASAEAQRRASTALLARVTGDTPIDDELAISLLREAVANITREATLTAALLSASANLRKERSKKAAKSKLVIVDPSVSPSAPRAPKRA